MGCFTSKDRAKVQQDSDSQLVVRLTASKSATNAVQSTIDSTLKKEVNYFGSHKSIKSDYCILDTLGSGHLSKVRKAASLANQNFKVAIKSTNKLKINRNLRYLFKEIDILRQIDHPNIIKFYATYEDEKYIHLVTELCEGDQLFDRVQRKGYYPEPEAARVFLKILRCVHYLHNIGICHRDIKPENFLYVSKEEDSDIKLIDFGFSKELNIEEDLKQMSTIVGSPRYLAPEVLDGKYGPKCDMWSLGVLLYIILSGKFPFSGHTHQEIFWNIRVGKVNFKGKVWQKVSYEAQDLIKKLLTTDPNIRLSTKQTLRHPWVKLIDNDFSSQLDPKVIHSLRVSRNMSQLNKEFLISSVRYIPDSSLIALIAHFDYLDQNSDGFITTDSLEAALKLSSLELKSEEIKQIFNNNLLQRNDRINYTDFIIAEVLPDLESLKECLLQAFRYFSGESEYITVSNAYSGLLGLGKYYTFDNVLDMIKELFPHHYEGVTYEGVTYEEFEKLMLSKQ